MPAGGSVQAHRHCGARAGHRCAQDLVFPSFLQAPCAFRGADGGTASALSARLRRHGDADGSGTGTEVGHSCSSMVAARGCAGVKLVACGHTVHPVDPSCGTHRQPRAVYKYWARLRLQFQQSIVVTLQVPQLQVHRQSGGYFSCYTETWLTVQTVQKT